jgi:hypothetical protein
MRRRKRLLPPHPLRVNDVKPFPKFLHKLRDQFRHILQIAVPDHHGVPRGMVQRRRDSRLVAKVPRARDRNNSGILAGRLAQHCKGSVRAAIVHEHNFVRSAHEPVEHFPNPLQELRQNTLFLVDGIATERRIRAGVSGRRPLPQPHVMRQAFAPESQFWRAKLRYRYFEVRNKKRALFLNGALLPKIAFAITPKGRNVVHCQFCGAIIVLY